MDLSKITKFVLLLACIVYFFPKFNNGLFTFILKFMFYVLLMYICYILINDGINLITKHWGKAHLLWIDEREHIKDHTLTNLSRLGLIGALFRFMHYISFNKKRMLQRMWYSYLENIAATLTFILMVSIIIGFVVFRLAF